MNFIMLDYVIQNYGWIEHWTDSAIECYKRGCRCTDCPLPKPTGFCNMKSSVLALFRQFGSPEPIIKKKEEKAKRDEMINQAIFEGVKSGKSQKQIAKELDLNIYSLKKYMQKAGINLRYLKMYRS